ncbi:MAG: iron transporter FeoB, partial [Candidatus Glassbacteria bacterium RBG_16_58_8]
LSNGDHIVALSGNPNTGKSSIFNALTGLRQHVGNWPGKTVTRAEGGFAAGGKRYKLVDLPGTYSLLSASVEEEIARDFLLFGNPDAVITVMDATAIERNLNLGLQILEITDRVVIALNLMDEARRHGIEVDHRGLAKALGVPVIPTVARTREGLDDLVQAVSDVIDGKIRNSPRRIPLDPDLESAVGELIPAIRQAFPGLKAHRWIALRLLDGDPTVRRAVESGEPIGVGRG